MKQIDNDIRNCIEQQLESGIRKFIIYPFGKVGVNVKSILNEQYGIKEELIIDNHLCKYNNSIMPIEILEKVDFDDCVVLLASTNDKIYDELYNQLELYVDKTRIKEIQIMQQIRIFGSKYVTECGKYSYGSLCNHWLVKSVGAFCSFADGCDVVANHSIDYISTHSFIFYNPEINPILYNKYEIGKGENWFFEGVIPRGIIPKSKRITIGNDVWLGKNVIITNGSTIGNGVIAAAGAVITQDIPDYAIVAGIPAKIIRFRYTTKQIQALNDIAWWEWSDEIIRERYDDFFLPIDEFIGKYIK